MFEFFDFWKRKPKVYVTRWRVDTQYYKCAVPMPVKEGFECELDALNYRTNNLDDPEGDFYDIVEYQELVK
jgi:hypothetical protein